jgi:predicted phosphodiesterase
MRVFALSDLHLEHDENSHWLSDLSVSEFQDDILILAGDLASDYETLASGFRALASRFHKVLYVPGNHELWITEAGDGPTSLDKFFRVCALAADHGVLTSPFEQGALSIVPLFAWYDYTFGEPCAGLQRRWMDFRTCKWPEAAGAREIADYFLALNAPAVYPRHGRVISFSHFVPRIDVLPAEPRPELRMLYPVLGTTRLDEQIRALQPSIHVYGHSHLNHAVTLDGTSYVNNAFGYPNEGYLAAKRLRWLDQS